MAGRAGRSRTRLFTVLSGRSLLPASVGACVGGRDGGEAAGGRGVEEPPLGERRERVGSPLRGVGGLIAVPGARPSAPDAPPPPPPLPQRPRARHPLQAGRRTSRGPRAVRARRWIPGRRLSWRPSRFFLIGDGVTWNDTLSLVVLLTGGDLGGRWWRVERGLRYLGPDPNPALFGCLLKERNEKEKKLNRCPE